MKTNANRKVSSNAMVITDLEMIIDEIKEK